MTDFRRGVRVGVDVGLARRVVARSDPDGLLATPVETVPRNEQAVARILAIAAEENAVELVVGLPLGLSGHETPSTHDARRFAAELARGPLPVRLVDERLSTVTAQSALRASGRTARSSRSIVDQAAAVVLLQHAIDVEKRTGVAPGSPAAPPEEFSP